MNVGNPADRVRALFTDPGVRATAAARLIMLVGAPVSLYLAATRLRPGMQGYYFVGVNIVALAQLFELGLGTIIVQFASHEWPRLRWGARGGLEGDPIARDAIKALLLAALRWYAWAAIGLFVLAGGGGVVAYGNVFSRELWSFVVLWGGFAVITALYLLTIPFICVAEGCGDLVAVQRMRAWQAAAVLISLWTGIIWAGPLAAAWLAATAQLLVAIGWLVIRHPGLLRAPRSLPAHLLDRSQGLPAQYRAEQKRSAQFWLALFLMPQLLAPILLRVRGGDDAGRLGITLAIAIAPLTLSVAWLHGRYPSFGVLIAARRTLEFDALARRATGEAVAIFLTGALCLVVTVRLLPHFVPAMALRILPLGYLAALLCGSLASLLIQAMAGWLRAFRDEGFAAPVVAGASGVVLVSGICGAVGGVRFMVSGFALASLCFAVPVAATHFFRVRRERLAA